MTNETKPLTQTDALKQMLAEAEDGMSFSIKTLEIELASIRNYADQALQAVKDGQRLPGGFDLLEHARRADVADAERLREAREMKLIEYHLNKIKEQ